MTRPIDTLNACAGIDLIEVCNSSYAELRIIVSETKALETPSLPNGIRRIHILTDETCKTFRIVWKQLIGYSFRNSDWAAAQDGERYSGGVLVQYLKSQYLDFIERSSIDLTHVVGDHSHWRLFCLNQILDVASGESPEIIRLQ